MPKISLILMDDSQPLKTASVTDLGLQGAFEVLMSHLTDNVESYVCGPSDPDKIAHRIIKYDIQKALRRPVTKREVLEFNTPDNEPGAFSIVWRWHNDES